MPFNPTENLSNADLASDTDTLLEELRREVAINRRLIKRKNRWLLIIVLMIGIASVGQYLASGKFNYWQIIFILIRFFGTVLPMLVIMWQWNVREKRLKARSVIVEKLRNEKRA